MDTVLERAHPLVVLIKDGGVVDESVIGERNGEDADDEANRLVLMICQRGWFEDRRESRLLFEIPLP